MVALFDHIKTMYEEQLYSNVVTFATMVITVNDNNYIDHVAPFEAFQTYFYYADSLFQLKHYRKAESIYRKILQIKKTMIKPRGVLKPNDVSKDLPSEVEIKYKIYLCYVNTNQSTEALEILQSIPSKQRTTKVNMELGRICDKVGLGKQAIAAYKEVLKACPFSIEAVERLLALSVPLSSVIDLMLNGVLNVPAWDSPGGIKDFVEALGLARAGQWADAANALCSIDKPYSLLKGCPIVYIILGEIYYYSGEYKLAIGAFQKAHAIDPMMLRGLDCYAACLARENRLRDRADVLIPPTLPTSEFTIQHWLTLAHLHIERHKLPLASFLARKAFHADHRNPEVLLLKGHIFMGMKKYLDALDCFREALQFAPERYESYSGFAEANIAVHRPRQAVVIAAECVKKFNQSSRALTLYANMKLKEGGLEAHAVVRETLMKAISADGQYLPALLTLAKIINSEKESDADVSLLEQQVRLHPSSELHQALGEIWAKRGGSVGAEHAVLHYGNALTLDPGSRRALDALARLDRLPTTEQANQSGSVPTIPEQGIDDGDNTCELPADAHGQSDNSNAPEESETEAVWSDMDLEVT